MLLTRIGMMGYKLVVTIICEVGDVYSNGEIFWVINCL